MVRVIDVRATGAEHGVLSKELSIVDEIRPLPVGSSFQPRILAELVLSNVAHC